ncbi:MAG: hypothetical protein AAF108_09240 [Planctomycetota bacterium]
MTQPDPTPLHPLAIAIRRELSGTLLDGDAAWRTRVVVDPASATIVVNLPSEVAESAVAADVLVLAMPDEGGLQVQLGSIERLDPRLDARCDRWRAHHTPDGAEDHAAFACGAAVGAKSEQGFADAEDLRLACAFAKSEPSLCRRLNAESGWKRSLLVNADAEVPVLVGVDAFGIWLRLRFGVRFLAFPRLARDADDAADLALTL